MYSTDLSSLIESLGPAGFHARVVELLDEKELRPEDFGLRRLAEACGVFGGPGVAAAAALSALRERAAGPALSHLSEYAGAAGARTDLFRAVTAELLGRKVTEGYDAAAGLIGDALVTVVPAATRGAKLAGFSALPDPLEVGEGTPYEETSFADKYVTAAEHKVGRVLSLTEELIYTDQTGEAFRRALRLGEALRRERDRTIVRAVADAATAPDDVTRRPVYRPDGVAADLYKPDGSHRNVVGPANTISPGYDAAVPLRDAASLDTVTAYRATQVVDDPADGPARPVVAPATQLLVPASPAATARSAVSATQVRRGGSNGGGGETTTVGGNPHAGLTVLSSPFLDEIGAGGVGGGDATKDWYLGDFRKQFVWTEIWPVQTFLQRADGPAAFEKDVAVRVKARYFGGVSCTGTAHVTKVFGG